jgi:hypothetical protein
MEAALEIPSSLEILHHWRKIQRRRFTVLKRSLIIIDEITF